MKSKNLKNSQWVQTLAFTLVFLHSCAHSPGPVETSEKVKTLSNDQFETIAIVGLNDIHGALSPERLQTKDEKPVSYERGGALFLSSQLNVLKKEMGGRLLILDAGDHFQGSLDSNLFEGKSVTDFFNTIGLNAATIGNHEFDFGAGKEAKNNKELSLNKRAVLMKRISESKFPYLAANIYTKKGEFPGVIGTQKSVLLTAGKLKVGIIGLTTLDTPVTTRAENVSDLEFRDFVKTTVDEAKALREKGANIVLALTHAGVSCTEKLPFDANGKNVRENPIKTEEDLQSECNPKDEIPQFLKKLPKGVIDAVVSGHTHTVVHHWIEGVPVIQSGTRNYYQSTLYLTYNWNEKRIEKSLTKIEGPVPICPKVFENQRNCNGDQPLPKNGRGSLVMPIFHGEKIKEDQKLASALSPYFSQTAEVKKSIIGEALRPIEHLKKEESPLGNLIADAIRNTAHTDFALMNPGGIRANITAGNIYYEDLFRVHPFQNDISILKVTGKQLKNILRVATTGWRGYFSVSGLKLRIIEASHEPEREDWNKDGKYDYWEANRLIEARDQNNNLIEDNKEYTLSTLDFLVTGGDSMAYPMSFISKNKITLQSGVTVLDALVEEIKNRKKVNSESQPLVDPNQRRLTFEAPPKRKSTKVGKKRKSSKKKK